MATTRSATAAVGPKRPPAPARGASWPRGNDGVRPDRSCRRAPPASACSLRPTELFDLRQCQGRHAADAGRADHRDRSAAQGAGLAGRAGETWLSYNDPAWLADAARPGGRDRRRRSPKCRRSSRALGKAVATGRRLTGGRLLHLPEQPGRAALPPRQPQQRLAAAGGIGRGGAQQFAQLRGRSGIEPAPGAAGQPRDFAKGLLGGRVERPPGT